MGNVEKESLTKILEMHSKFNFRSLFIKENSSIPHVSIKTINFWQTWIKKK
jgi:hypothetical protein